MEKYGKSFKQLNRKEKMEYIAEYYKVHIIGGVIGLIILYSVLNHFVFHPPKDVIVDVTFTAAYLEPQGFEALQKEVKEYVEERVPGKTGQVEHLFFSENNDPQTQMVMTTKLVGKASTGELDILILDKDHLAYFKENEALLPLSDYLSEEQINRFAENGMEVERNSKDIAVAFQIKKQSKIGKLFPDGHDSYFGISSGARDIKLIQEVIPLLF